MGRGVEVRLDCYRVLVTAGANGIGLEIARAFASSGAKVHVCDLNRSALTALATESSRISSTLCDVADREQVGAMMDAAVSALGGLDVLINNAGIAGPTGRVDRIPPEEWDRTLAVNITGQFNVTRLAIPELVKGRRSSIICISSAAGRLAFPNRSAYAASKWAVIGFMKTIAAELGDLGVRANAILPGMVDGRRLQSVLAAKAVEAGLTREEVLRRATAGLSTKSLVAPEKIAATALFLASELASAINGQGIAVDNDAHYMI
jgi:NAD(P)-dependent dehydrogenase (short-subunit alcohol dehydrogenase family)